MTDSATRSPVVPVLRHAGDTTTCSTFTPEDDSQPVVFVGSRASAEQIGSLCHRHGLDCELVQAFARKGGAA